ncbi:MAG: hypothetical protein L6Q70_15470, partial [Thauera sp.]|nr:hypothetical protein [Thauera sp.]
ELAATAEELGGQAGQLQELMGFFNLASGGAAPSRAAGSARKAGAAASADSMSRAKPARPPARVTIGKPVSFSESDFEKF